jgi:hypothetical protein
VIDPDIKEPEALADLLGSDGWQLLREHLETEWGAAAYARRMDGAIAAAKAANRSAEGDICELAAAVRAVQVFTQWPTERLRQLKAKPATVDPWLSKRRA